jgi:ketosteroid isomerase-like protein
MKKKFFTSILVIVTLFAGCSAVVSPKDTVQKFYKAIEENDIKAMSEVATPETVQLMAMFGTKAQGALAENGKIKSLTETIDGDTAVVTVTFENGEEEKVDLIKADEKWKVSISMDNK